MSSSETSGARKFAIVTRASSGIGHELAKLAAQNGFDLAIAADQGDLDGVAQDLRGLGPKVEALRVYFATKEGVEELVALDRPSISFRRRLVVCPKNWTSIGC